MSAKPHISVLLDEVIDNLAAGPGDTVVDGTFGAGGYARAILATTVIIPLDGRAINLADSQGPAKSKPGLQARSRARFRDIWQTHTAFGR